MRKNSLKRDFIVMEPFPSRITIGPVQTFMFWPYMYHEYFISSLWTGVLPHLFDENGHRKLDTSSILSMVEIYESFRRFSVFVYEKLHFWKITMTPNLDLTLSTSLKLHLNEWQRSTTYQTVFSHLVRPCLRVREAKKVAFLCVSA